MEEENRFSFRVHKPSAIYVFLTGILIAVGGNAWLLQVFSQRLQPVTLQVEKSWLLVVPWFVVLFLPSVITGILLARISITRKILLVEEDGLHIQHRNVSKVLLWNELISYRLTDFENDEYFVLKFSERKNNFVIHRSSGNFEKFFFEFSRFVPAEKGEANDAH